MNSKALVGILAGILLVVIAAYFWLAKSGKQVLEAEVAAMNSAQSWRIRTELDPGTPAAVVRIQVAICPDKEHVYEKIFGTTSEYIRIGDDTYFRQGNGAGKQESPGPDLFVHFVSPRPCLTDPKEPNAKVPKGSAELKEWIEEDVRLSQVTKGVLKQDEGVTCREWIVRREGPHGVEQDYTACIVEWSHLPRYKNAARGALLTHYEWNLPLTIKAPDLNEDPKEPVAP